MDSPSSSSSLPSSPSSQPLQSSPSGSGVCIPLCSSPLPCLDFACHSWAWFLRGAQTGESLVGLVVFLLLFCFFAWLLSGALTCESFVASLFHCLVSTAGSDMWTTNVLLPLLSLLLLFIVSLLRCFSQVDPLDCFVAHVVCCFVASLLQGAWRGGSTGMSSSFHYSWCPFCAVVSVGHCWTSLSSVLSINIQVSWHGRRWWKELGDPEKGFYGWVRSCNTKFFSNGTIRLFCTLRPIFRFATVSTFQTVLHTRCKVSSKYLSPNQYFSGGHLDLQCRGSWHPDQCNLIIKTKTTFYPQGQR